MSLIYLYNRCYVNVIVYFNDIVFLNKRAGVVL